MKKQDVEIINAEIETLNESITWWSNRFNAVERDNRELRKEIEKLNKALQSINKILQNEYNELTDYTGYIYKTDLINKLLDIVNIALGSDKD